MLQPGVEEGKFGCKQAAHQQTRPQTPVACKQPHPAPQAPQPQQQCGPHPAHRRLEHRRQFGHGGLDHDLLKAPEHAAHQQHAHSQGIQVVFAGAVGQAHACDCALARPAQLSHLDRHMQHG